MPIGHVSKKILALFFPMLIIHASACISMAEETRSEKALRDRVSGYMQAVIDGKWNEAYPYMMEGYRATVSPDQFAHVPRNVRTQDYAIESIEIEANGDEARVALSLTIAFQGHAFPNAPQTQTWIMEKGNWHLQIDAAPSSRPIPVAP